MQEERCCECGDLTGRAGRADDSLFYETADGDEIGPLCLECYHRIRSDAFDGVQLIVEDMRAENARLRRQVERLKQWDAVFRDGYLCGLMEKVPQDVGCFDESEMQWSWDKSTAKTLRDAILADEQETP